MGRRLYAKPPSSAEAALFGLTVEEASGPPAEVWPDNAIAVNIFLAASTQWRVGPAGVIGLDYTAVEAIMRMHRIPKKNRSEVLEGIRTLEDAGMEAMRKP